MFKSIGIDHVVNPRITAAREILEIISRGHLGAVVRLSDVDIEAVRVTVEPGSEIAGMKIERLSRKLRKGTIIGVIVRQGSLVLPSGDTTVEDNDHLIVITRHANLGKIANLLKSKGFFSRR